jgi:excinuclease ABC subunit C
MANKNAKDYLDNNLENLTKKDDNINYLWTELGKVLGIEDLSRIEIFDNAHLFGTYAVSGMVVYKDGVKAPSDYRKYKVQGGKDDYASMREVVYRRYYKCLMEQLPLPSCIIVDGGLGQVNAAKEVLDELKMNIPIFGLAKDAKHKTKQLIDSEGTPVTIEDRRVFNYLWGMQEEVHRFTISFHTASRSKGVFSSELDKIKGLGPARKKVLLDHFKNMNELKKADILTLEKLVPRKIAEEIVANINNNS